MDKNTLKVDGLGNPLESGNFNSGKENRQPLSLEEQNVLNNISPEQLEKALAKAKNTAGSIDEKVDDLVVSKQAASAMTSKESAGVIVDPEILTVKSSMDTDSLKSHLAETDFIDGSGNPKINLQEFLDNLQNRKN